MKYIVFGGLIISLLCSSILAMTHRNLAGLLWSALTHQLPGFHHVQRIREDLLSQRRFVKLLANHEQKAMDLFQSHGKSTHVKRYVYRTPISMFDLPSFTDYWETWIRTDIVNNNPQTSYLIRLGIIGDERSGSFIGKQCNTKLCRVTMQSLGSINHMIFDLGIMKPFRLNITEADETSSVSRKRLLVKEWNAVVERRHRSGQGKPVDNRSW